MALTEYAVNHPLAVKRWSEKLNREALKRTYISRFIGNTSSSLIQKKTEVSKAAGDRITVGLRMQLSGTGIQGDDTLEGNEEQLTTYSDNVFINQLRHAVRSKGKMSEQRVTFSVREEAMDALADWYADRMDAAFFNQIAGNASQTDTKYTGNQVAIEPSSSRYLFFSAAATSNATMHALESSISTTDTFQLTILDRAVTAAKTASPLIRPIKVNGEDFYVAFLHPYQVFNLRTDATANRVTWYDTQKARIQGGQTGESVNPIFSGALGVYNNVVLHESTRIPTALSNTSARRAVFCGAQAALIAFGQEQSSDDNPTWREEMFDYGNQLGVAASKIWGLKKSVFNSTDFGTIVMSTYAVAP